MCIQERDAPAGREDPRPVDAKQVEVQIFLLWLQNFFLSYDGDRDDLWRPWVSPTGMLCARRVAWFGIVWELCWLVTAQANWSRLAATSFQSRLLCAIWNQVATWNFGRMRWGAIVPNSTSNVLEWKVIMAGFLICQVRILYGVLIYFCECCFRSSLLLLLAFDIIASSRLQRAIPDPNQMSQ